MIRILLALLFAFPLLAAEPSADRAAPAPTPQEELAVQVQAWVACDDLLAQAFRADLDSVIYRASSDNAKAKADEVKARKNTENDPNYNKAIVELYAKAASHDKLSKDAQELSKVKRTEADGVLKGANITYAAFRPFTFPLGIKRLDPRKYQTLPLIPRDENKPAEEQAKELLSVAEAAEKEWLAVNAAHEKKRMDAFHGISVSLSGEPYIAAGSPESLERQKTAQDVMHKKNDLSARARQSRRSAWALLYPAAHAAVYQE